MADVPDWAKEILDLRAGKDHSAQGPVMACLEEILTRHGAETRTRVLATMDQALKTLIDRENGRDGEPVLDVETLEHVRRLLRMQAALLSHAESVAHNAQAAEEAMAAPARPDSREELQARIDQRVERQTRTKVAAKIRQVRDSMGLHPEDPYELGLGRGLGVSAGLAESEDI